MISHLHFVCICVFFADCFFFFQAEGGIRDTSVTGVQTCALPILKEGFSGHHKTIVCSSMAACMTAQTLLFPVLRAERTMPRVTPFHACSSKAARPGSELQPAKI